MDNKNTKQGISLFAEGLIKGVASFYAYPSVGAKCVDWVRNGPGDIATKDASSALGISLSVMANIPLAMYMGHPAYTLIPIATNIISLMYDSAKIKSEKREEEKTKDSLESRI